MPSHPSHSVRWTLPPDPDLLCERLTAIGADPIGLENKATVTPTVAIFPTWRKAWFYSYGRARLSPILLAQPLATTHVSRHTADLVGDPACFVEHDGSVGTYDLRVVLMDNSHDGHSRLAQCGYASACNAGLLQPLLVPAVPRLNGIPSR